MKVGLGGALLLASMLGLSLLTGPASAMPADGGSTAPAAPAEPRKRAVLPVCESPSAMNCIESIEYKADGQWLMGILRVGRYVISEDGNGNIVYGDDYYEYQTPGLLHEGDRASVLAILIERDDVNGPPYGAYQFILQTWPQDADLFWDPPINRCEDKNLNRPGSGPCARTAWLADTEYRFTFRTSTLAPIIAVSSVVGLSTSLQEIAGGLRVAITGRPGPSQFWPDEETDSFRGITYGWEGFIADARARNGILEACQGLGIATAYSNGYGGQMPEWDARAGSLSFGVGGFHYAPDGSVYKGEAEIYVPGPLARCMWNVDPRQTARMEVEIFTENGEEVAGTKAISYDAESDVVKLIATNFTYSNKQIVARSTPVAAKPGKKACDPVKVLCVTVDKTRKTAKVSVSKVPGNSGDVVAVALRGSREDGNTQVTGRVNKGKASFSVPLSGAKSKGQVWVLRTQSTFISSFQVG
jgi:hypothetical protein